MKKHKNKIIIAIIILAMIVPMILEMVGNNKPQGITYADFKEILSNKEDAVIYLDSKKSPVNNTLLGNLKVINDKGEVKAEYLDYDSLSEDEKIELVGLNSKAMDGPAFAFINKGNITDVRNGAFSSGNLLVLYDRFFAGDAEDIYYKVAGSVDDFIETAAKDKTLMVVLGRTSCTYCEQFQPIYNKVASQFDIEMYYFDSDYYDQGEFSKLMAKNYTIPGYSSSMKGTDDKAVSCTENGQDAKIANGYGTPLTLFIKGGKTIDCISGMVDEQTLVNVLKFNKIAAIKK